VKNVALRFASPPKAENSPNILSGGAGGSFPALSCWLGEKFKLKVRGGRKNRYCSKLPATTHQLLSSNLEQERKIDLSRPVYASVQHLGLLGRIFLSPREIYCRVLLPRNGFSECMRAGSQSAELYFSANHQNV
jgi:hypothetical protein